MPQKGDILSRVGEKYKNHQGFEMEIIQYEGWDKVTVLFDNGSTLKDVQFQTVIRGTISNPFYPNVVGVGYFGQGEYTTSWDKERMRNYKNYDLWKSMLLRCYDKKQAEKFPAYVGVTVCEHWHNFQNFAKWFENNYIEGFVLDKDILFKGNKLYSPETCCFVPVEINALLIKADSKRGDYPIGVVKVKSGKYVARIGIEGSMLNKGTFNTPEEAFQAYKVAKEERISELADKWKEQITPQTYQALCNYQVEITD